MIACSMAGASCPDTSHGTVTEPCARCGCARRTHHPVNLRDGGTANPCRGHHLSGGHSGMIQQCGCQDFEPRIVHCEHSTTVLGDPECCCCSLSPCERALEDDADMLLAHVRAEFELHNLHTERAVRYALAHGEREPRPF